MKLSTKARYGIRAVLELSLHYGNGPLRSKVIAQRQDISIKYLEQLMIILKTSGIVQSIRGSKGGYVLVREPGDLKVSEVYMALEGPTIMSVECLEDKSVCGRAVDCLTRELWQKVEDAIEKVLSSITFGDMVARVEKNNALYYQI